MFEWLRESIWGYPIIAAIHVLGLAWFGATVLTGVEEYKTWKKVGLAVMLLSGALLFGMHPGMYWGKCRIPPQDSAAGARPGIETAARCFTGPVACDHLCSPRDRIFLNWTNSDR